MATTTTTQTAQAAGRAQWMYHVSHVRPSEMAEYAGTMTEMGRKGWEVVSVTPVSLHGWFAAAQGATNELMFVWKRPA